MQEEEVATFKVVVVGSVSTGKTSIFTRFMKNQFMQHQRTTVGVQFLSKTIKIDNKNVKITLWDTAGQQRYKSLSKVYYKGTAGVLIIYSITDPQSYIDVQSWLRLIADSVDINQVVMMIVGNKVDLEDQRKVSSQRPIKQYKDKFDIDCWEVSAKTGYNIKQVFIELVQKIYQIYISPQSRLKYDESIASSVFDQSIAKRGTAGGQFVNRLNNKVTNKQMHSVVMEEQQEVAKKRVNGNKQNGSTFVRNKKNDAYRLTDNKTQKNEKQKKCC